MRAAAVILAAGCSARMGRPKQTLAYQGQSLLRGAAATAFEAGCEAVYVVLGAFRQRLAEDVATLPVHIVENPDWSYGMGTSIVRGVAAACSGATDAVLLMLCDQPLVDAASLQRLIEAGREHVCDIAAAAYADTTGAPALFKRPMFDALLALHAAEGAKKLIGDPRFRVMAVPMPAAAVDIDTPEDYRRVSEQGEPSGIR